MRPEIVPATPELTEAYFGRKSDKTFRGWVGVLDGKPVGLCGIYNDGGYPVVFGDIAPELRPYRKTIVEGIRRVRRMMDESRLPVMAVMSREEPTAPALLAKLGFVPTGREIDDGPVFERKPG